jgi:hypothetical protein
MHAAHVWSRNNKSIRWNLDNGFCFCYYHHLLWSHRSPVEYTEWCKQHLGEEMYYNLRDLAMKNVGTITIEDLYKIKEYLEKMLKFYQDKNESDLF